MGEGLEAMMANVEDLPDLIMVDLNMPVMDDWQFLDVFSRLTSEDKSLVIIVSPSIDPSDLRKAKNYFFVKEFVVKPLTAPKLKELVGVYQKGQLSVL